jgi:hypothetical protein
MENALYVRNIGSLLPPSLSLPFHPDIIALLIISVLLVSSFFFWEYHVTYRTTRQPLMRLALWTRAKGRLAAVYFIGFVAFMGFIVRLC